MSKLTIERLGGFAGFGAGGSRLRSLGEIDMEQLSIEDKKTVEDLFVSNVKSRSTISTDTFRFKISRGAQSIEVEEDDVPAAVKQCVRDEIV